jgi:hypothetical protein
MFQKPTLIDLFSSRRAMLRYLIVVAAALAVMTVLTVTLGVHQSGPSYDLITDPGAGLPF